MNAPLSFIEFESWLASLDADTPVGVPCLSGTCPIANWASNLVGRTVMVGRCAATILYEEGDEEVPLDRGLRLFVSCVDERWPDTEISAGQARLACRAVRESLGNS